MKYLSGCLTKNSVPYLNNRVFGLLVTPKTDFNIAPSWTYAADNGCFNASTYVGDDKWFDWLQSVAERDHDNMEGCLFATAPDVVGDAAATARRSMPWMDKIRSLGLPAAYVAQNGITVQTTPWDDLDWLFIGGDNDFKLGTMPIHLTEEAHARGKRVHVGRVNSYKRLRHCGVIVNADTADGTYLGFGPDTNLPKLLGWIDRLDYEIAA